MYDFSFIPACTAASDPSLRLCVRGWQCRSYELGFLSHTRQSRARILYPLFVTGLFQMPQLPFSTRDRIIAGASFFERYILSSGYFWLAYRQGQSLQKMALEWPVDATSLTPLLGRMANDGILFFVQLFIGALLLTNKNPVRPPRRLREIFVPLISCLYFVLYAFVPLLPGGLSQNGFHGPVPLFCVVSGLCLGLAGASLALWGVLSLGKSFGVFVSVRKVVLHGPYRFVRHPIYLGYFFVWFGLLVINLSPAMLMLVAGHLWLFRFRARLEEEGLLAESESYQAYSRGTGFLFPRFFHRGDPRA